MDPGTIGLSSDSGTKIPRVLSLDQFQGLQVEHKQSRSRKDVTDVKSVNDMMNTKSTQTGGLVEGVSSYRIQTRKPGLIISIQMKMA